MKISKGSQQKGNRLKKMQADGVSGELFELIATRAPVGISVVDEAGNCAYVNECWCAMTGLTRELAAGQGWFSSVHPEDRERMMSLQKEVVKGLGKWQGEYRFLNEKGEVVWVYGQIAALRDRAGYLLGCLWTHTEVNSYKREVEELRKSEEKFHAIADYTFDWEYWVDPDGTYRYISPSVHRLTGYTAEQLHTDPDLLLAIIHPDDHALFKKHLAEQFQEKAVCQFDFRIVSKKSEVRWISHICQPVFDSRNNFLGRRASNRDITGRKRALEELSISEQRFRLALDASSDGVWDRDLITNEVYYGENWHRVLGYSDEEAKSKEFSWKKLLHPGDREKTFAAIQEHFEGRAPRYEAEFRMRNRRGEWQWFLSRGKVVTRDEHGRPLRFVGTHTDITKSKNYEIELQQTRDNLEKMVKERTAELEEANVALKVLLKKREKDKVELQRSVVKNLASLIDPYLAKLGRSALSDGQQLLLDILKTNLNELTSSFSSSFAARWVKFTPAEIQVANLIKIGKSTKDIAVMMNVSPGTINIHRKNIRKKLGLTNQKANLQTVLSSVPQEG